jgi:hypothetical protein
MSDIVTVKRTGVGTALAYSLSPGHAFELVEFTCHFSAIPTTPELFSATKNIVDGAVYDASIYAKDLSEFIIGLPADISFSLGKEEINFNDGDSLDFAYLNSDGLTWGFQLKYRRVY